MILVEPMVIMIGIGLFKCMLVDVSELINYFRAEAFNLIFLKPDVSVPVTPSSMVSNTKLISYTKKTKLLQRSSLQHQTHFG